MCGRCRRGGRCAQSAVPVRVGPAAPDQVPVPAQQRGRSNQERRPPFPRQQPRQHSQHQPIRWGVPGSGDLPAHHGQLMPQNGDLHVLCIRRRTDPSSPSTRRSSTSLTLPITPEDHATSASALVNGITHHLHPSGDVGALAEEAERVCCIRPDGGRRPVRKDLVTWPVRAR